MNKKIKTDKDGTFESPVIYNDFWSPKVLDMLQEIIKRQFRGEIPAVIQYSIWPEDLWKDSGPILIIDLNNEKEIIESIKSELNVIYDTSNLNYWYCGIHIFLKGAYIPTHDDKEHDFATTTYLNIDGWNADWGGALLTMNKRGKMGVLFPEYNKMVVQSGPYNKGKDMWHTTTITSQSAPPRISMQISGAMEASPHYNPAPNI